MKRIGGEMYQYMKIVLDRDNIQHEYRPDTGEIVSSMSARRFKEALEDAFCEKQKADRHSRIPVYSAKTLRNKKKVERLMKLNGTTSFVILHKDAYEYLYN